MTTPERRLPVLFVDDGGVLSDNRLRAPEWQRLAGEFFVPRLGGSHEAWARANREEAPPLWPRFYGTQLAPGETVAQRDAGYYAAWLEGMCRSVGVPPPEDAAALALEAYQYIFSRVQAQADGAAEAVRRLAAHGFTLHTSSAQRTWELEIILDTMGIREHFSTVNGSDTINCLKVGGTLFHERIFAHAGVDPAEAIVFDDSPDCVGWARELGSEGILIGADGDAASLAAAAETLIARFG